MALDDSIGRLRSQAVAPKAPKNVDFINPYPWMSSIEARVHLALEAHNVPFCWRYFDGVAPTFLAQFGESGYQPEFTILELKTILIVQGAFWGALDEVLDTVALAEACFAQDGWTVAVLWEGEILSLGAWELMLKLVPAISTISGVQRVNPYATSTVKSMMIRSHGGMRDKLTPILGGIRDNVRSIRAGAYANNSVSGRRRLGRKGAVTNHRNR